MSDRIYCSEVAQAEGASLAGTALRVDVWVLVEYARPWKSKALEDNDLPPEVNAALAALPARVQSASGGLARVQFVKQAASGDREGPRVLVADVRTPRPVRARTLKSYADLVDLDGRFDDFETELPPQLLVCTNGQRDLCCARFGLPLYEALRLEWGPQVWQTTHVGGHRYAPNLVCLPDGAMYGFVLPDLGSAVVTEHLAGRVSRDQLRGFSRHSPVEQAALAFAREFLAEIQVDALDISACAADGEQVSAQITHRDGRSVTVRLRHQVGVDRVLASCGAEPKAADRFELIEIESA